MEQAAAVAAEGEPELRWNWEADHPSDLRIEPVHPSDWKTFDHPSDLRVEPVHPNDLFN